MIEVSFLFTRVDALSPPTVKIGILIDDIFSLFS